MTEVCRYALLRQRPHLGGFVYLPERIEVTRTRTHPWGTHFEKIFKKIRIRPETLLKQPKLARCPTLLKVGLSSLPAPKPRRYVRQRVRLVPELLTTQRPEPSERNRPWRSGSVSNRPGPGSHPNTTRRGPNLAYGNDHEVGGILGFCCRQCRNAALRPDLVDKQL